MGKVNIFLVLFLFPKILFGEIIETSNFEDVLQKIDQKVCVIFDLDNTLMMADQQLGCVAWGEHVISQLEGKGILRKKAEIIENILWKAIQPHIKVRVVDKKIPGIIDDLKKQKMMILGLTARSPDEAACTINQLSSIGISFEKQFEEETFFLENETLYKDGILFGTSFNKKSEVLFAFLNKHALTPCSILFVDDKLSHLKDMEKACQSREIVYTGIRFGGADQQFKDFDPKIAAIQWELFPYIISDQKALHLSLISGTNLY